MQTLTFSNNDQMPVVGLGTWKAEPGEVGQAVREAIKAGYRHIDCAPIYGNEAEIGEALQACFESGQVSRDELWVTSKLWNNAHSEQQVPVALEKTLYDLKLDFLDLYLIHWPVVIRPEVIFPTRGDQFLPLDEVPLSETWKGMESCVKAGLTRHIGVSNFSVSHLQGISRGVAIKPEVNQVEMHPYLQQKELYAYCQEQGAHLTAYSPLGSGDRPDVMKKPGEMSLLGNPVVIRIAQAHSCSPAQVLIKWAVQTGVSVVPKSTNPARLAENLRAADIELTPQDMSDLAGLDCGFRYVNGEFWAIDGSPYTVETLWGEP